MKLLSGLSLTLFTLSLHAATIVPFERDAPRPYSVYYGSSSHSESNHWSTGYRYDFDENPYYYGFTIYNYGPNDIIPPDSGQYVNRSFVFSTHDNAKRDPYLWITDDVGSGRTSDYMETLMVFIPRENQFHIEEVGDELAITLPTGEEAIMSSKKKVFLRGVLSEKAIDMNPDRSQRKFAQVDYSGIGMVIRVDKRAGDPRLDTKAKILRAGEPECVVASSEFFTQEDWPHFRFVSDDDVQRRVSDLCD